MLFKKELFLVGIVFLPLQPKNVYTLMKNSCLQSVCFANSLLPCGSLLCCHYAFKGDSSTILWPLLLLHWFASDEGKIFVHEVPHLAENSLNCSHCKAAYSHQLLLHRRQSKHHLKFLQLAYNCICRCLVELEDVRESRDAVYSYHEVAAVVCK